MSALMHHPSTATGISVYHVGGTEEVTMAELAEKLFRTAGWRPHRVDRQPAPAGSVSRRKPDIAKIRDQIGWAPRVSLDQGLAPTFAWYALHAEQQDG